MSKEIHFCEVCGISSQDKRVNFIEAAGKFLCRKHREQFMKYGEFKDNNSRGIFDSNEIRKFENHAEIDTYDQFGNVTETYILDLEDIDKLEGKKWMTVYKTGKPYLKTGNQKSKIEYFHRIIMNNPDNQVDHIDGNTLNNKKSNLRIVSLEDNMKNLKKKSTNTSGIRGVSFSERDQLYKVDFTYEKKRYYFKGFPTKAEAVALRFLCEKYILKEYRNTSNDELYKSYIDELTDSQKKNLIKYFKEKVNTSKDGVNSI